VPARPVLDPGFASLLQAAQASLVEAVAITDLVTPKGSPGPVGMDLFGIAMPNWQAPINPTMIPGLVLWIKADDPGITLNAGAVVTWPDRSGAGNNMQQATGANQPTYNTSGGPNNLAWVQFVGASSQFMDVGRAILSALPYTAMATILFTADNVDQSAFSIGAGGVGPSMMVDASGADTSRSIKSWGVANMLDSAATTSWEVWNTNTTAAPLTTLAVNGTSQTITPNNTAVSVSGAGCRVGQSPATGSPMFLTGGVQEVIVYNRTLTALENGILTGYFQNRTRLW
jgi:hypothetical protein